MLPLLELDLCADGHLAIRMQLTDVNILELRLAVAFQADVFPDPDWRQLGAPVPAPMARGFAQVRPARYVAAAYQGFGRLPGLDIRHRGAEKDAQFIPAVFQEVVHFPVPLPEHVIGFSEQLAIEEYFGQRVQPVTDQAPVLFIRKGCLHGKAAPVFPVAFRHPLDFLLVVGHKRVGDASQGQQIGVHAARDSRREPLPAARFAKLPGAT